jgi:hypothetical protein
MGRRDGDERAAGSRASEVVGALLASLPALLCGALVASHAVDVPVWDDWERAKLLERSAGGLDWAYLYSPHIDHRIVLPRLVALANARLFGGNLTLEMGLSFAVVVATALGFHALLRRTLGTRRPAALWGTTFLGSALLFTPLQWENFLWAAQPFFLWPMGAAVAALLILSTHLAWQAKLALSLALAIVTTHTFSHGLPLWALVPAAVVLGRRFGPLRARAIFLGVWFAVAAAVLVPYFSVDGMRNTSEASHAFGAPPGQRVRNISADAVARDPLKVARFCSTMLGSPFARIGLVGPLDVAPCAGAALALLFAVPALLWLRRFRDAKRWDGGLPWVLLGGYGLALCLLTAVGRSRLTMEGYALLPHYVSVAIYPLLAALPLGVLALRETEWRSAAPFAAGLLGAAIGVGWLVGIDGMAEWKSARLQARTALHFAALFPPHKLMRLDGSREVLYRFAPVLDREGQLRPPLAKQPTLGAFLVEREPLDAEDAALTRVRTAGDEVLVTGHAWLAGAGRRADGVAFAVATDGGWRVVALGEMRGQPVSYLEARDHIMNEVELPGLAEFAHFKARWLAASALPEVPRALVVPFAIDAARMRAHPLHQRLWIERPPRAARLEVRVLDAGEGW